MSLHLLVNHEKQPKHTKLSIVVMASTFILIFSNARAHQPLSGAINWHISVGIKSSWRKHSCIPLVWAWTILQKTIILQKAICYVHVKYGNMYMQHVKVIFRHQPLKAPSTIAWNWSHWSHIPTEDNPYNISPDLSHNLDKDELQFLIDHIGHMSYLYIKQPSTKKRTSR